MTADAVLSIITAACAAIALTCAVLTVRLNRELDRLHARPFVLYRCPSCGNEVKFSGRLVKLGTHWCTGCTRRMTTIQVGA